MNRNIDKEEWHICKICNQNIKYLSKLHGGSGVYYTQVFKKHLEIDHNIKLEDYFQNRPLCKCGICNQSVDIGGIKKSNFYWREYKCGRNKGIMKWSEKAKIHRKGKGNPMYQKDPWNKGKTKFTHPSVMKSSKSNIGRYVSKDTKKKQSISAKNRDFHGHTGCKHSEQAKEKCRQATLNRIKNGDFKQLKSKPHINFRNILEKLNISFKEEYVVDAWSFDFYLIDYNIYIEVDGDYFHSNPIKYPNGPKTNTQKINWYRDLKKNKYCKEKNMILIRFWEYDIINNPELIEEVICKLKK